MKGLIKCLPVLLLMLNVSTGCSKEEDNPAGPSGNGAVRPRGTAMGAGFQVTVTPEGGTFKTPDEKLELIFPAGAVTENVTVTIQKVVNTNPAGVGDAWQFENVPTLHQPVRVRMHYGYILEAINTIESVLAIARQGDDGIWRLQPGRMLNPEEEKVEVSLTVLKDIGLMEIVRLIAESSVVEPKGSVQLELQTAISFESSINDLSRFWEDFLTIELPVYEPYTMPLKLVDRWQLGIGGSGSGGSGGSVTPNGSKASYLAPQSPGPGVSTVMAYVKGLNTPFKAEISHVSGPGYLRIQVGNKSYSFNEDDCHVSVANSQVSITWEGTLGMGGLHIDNVQPGEYKWSYSGISNEFWFEPSDWSPHSVFMSLIEDGTTTSPGSIQLIQVGAGGQQVVGVFTINPAGRYNLDDDGSHHSDVKVVGTFNLTRDE